MTGCQKSDLANFLAISEDFPVKIFMWSKIFWALLFIWCPVGGLVGDCGVRAVPRKTPIYFMVIFIFGIIKEILVAKRHFMTFEILIRKLAKKRICGHSVGWQLRWKLLTRHLVGWRGGGRH